MAICAEVFAGIGDAMRYDDQQHDSQQTVEAGEVAFGFDELFFSRTDLGGVIQFGNSVFQRISGYSWDELMGKPHKIIRHADMPRAVFWLLWRTIKEGRPIGAFVKNRAKDGRHYWVFAIVTPVDAGYLSVRLRPSSALLDVVKTEYASLATIERREGLAPQQSAEALLRRLSELGFTDYASFMASALGKELAARDMRLGRVCDTTISQFDSLLTTAQSLLSRANVVAEAYVGNESVPFNFRVLAAQLGQDGAAIGVISSNYTLLSTEMKTILSGFIASAQDVYRVVNEGYFLVCTARVQREVLEFFNAEQKRSDAASGAEVALLDRQQIEYRERAAAGLAEIAKHIRGFQQTCLDMNRLAAGLEVMRVMGKVECSRHLAVKERTDELLHDLEVFQRTVAEALKEIESMNHMIRSNADQLLLNAKAA